MIERFNGVKDYRWLKRYLRFIDMFKKDTIYTFKNVHNHHILPKSIYKEYKSLVKNPWNKAVLGHREHLIAHYMLAKALGGNMWFAYNNMNAHNVKLSPRLYEIAQKEFVNFRKGHIVSEETKQKISKTRKERFEQGLYNYSKTEEHKLNQSLSLKKKFENENHHTKGKTYEEIMGKEKADNLRESKSGENNVSKRDDVREKISQANKGISKSEEHKKKISQLVWMNKNNKNKRSKPEEVEKWLIEDWKLGKVMLTCPYCKKETDQANYKQWHGEKCKLNNKGIE